MMLLVPVEVRLKGQHAVLDLHLPFRRLRPLLLLEVRLGKRRRQ